MEFTVQILARRVPDTTMPEDAAAIVPDGAQTPKDFALINTVPIPPHLREYVERLFATKADGIISVTREELLALLAMMTSEGHKAGVKLGKEIAVMEK